MRTVYLANLTLAPHAHPTDAGVRGPMPKPRSGRAVRRLGSAIATTSTNGSVRAQVIARARAWLEDVAGEYDAPFPPLVGATACTGSEQEAGPDGGWQAILEHPYWHPALTARNVRQCIEVAVGAGSGPGGDDCTFTLRLSHQAAAGTLAAGTPVTPPSLVAALLDTFAAASGALPLSAAPARCGEDAVPALVAAVTDQERVIPVVVISKQPDNTPLVDPDAVARDLAGVAYVVELTDFAAAFPLSAQLTNPLSCFNGAVRIYWPGFTRDSDMYDHRLWLPDKLRAGDIAQRMPELLLREIADHLLTDERTAPATAITTAAWDEPRAATLSDRLSPAVVERLAAMIAAERAAPEPTPAPAMPPPADPPPAVPDDATLAPPPAPEPQKDSVAAPVVNPAPVPAPPAVETDALWTARLDAVEAQVEARLVARDLLLDRVHARIDDLQARLRLLEEDNKMMRRDNATLRDRLGELHPKTDFSYPAVRESTADVPHPSARVLEDLWDAAALAQKDFGGPHVVFTEAAFDAAADSPLQRTLIVRGYEYIRAVCDVAKRLHGDGLGQSVYDAFRELGIEYKSDISKTAATRHGKHYTFRWKTETGTVQEIMAGPHIGFGRGGANDSIRIYWYWDKPGKRFVLCHIGRHLPDEST